MNGQSSINIGELGKTTTNIDNETTTGSTAIDTANATVNNDIGSAGTSMAGGLGTMMQNAYSDATAEAARKYKEKAAEMIKSLSDVSANAQNLQGETNTLYKN